MPSSSQKNQLDVDSGPDRDGAGEPLGESAPPPGILERLPDEMREKLPDELVAAARPAEPSERDRVTAGVGH